jgi:hypothetical protein
VRRRLGRGYGKVIRMPAATASGRAVMMLVVADPKANTAPMTEARMHSFAIPVTAPEITISLLRHPRLDADSAHR